MIEDIKKRSIRFAWIYPEIPEVLNHPVLVNGDKQYGYEQGSIMQHYISTGRIISKIKDILLKVKGPAIAVSDLIAILNELEKEKL